MPSPNRSHGSFPFSLLSLLSAPVSWVALFASGRVSAEVFSEGATNTMFALLWFGAAVAVAGVSLGIVALRVRDSGRLLAIFGLILNLISLGLFAFLGLFWVALSV